MLLLDSLVSKECGAGVAPGPCGLLAALVHFFALSAIAWMGVEGFNTYIVIVKVFRTYIPKFMKKAMAAAWGVPALIVILTGAIARENYAQSELCFLQMWSQIGGLLIPMAIILTVNIIIFILVIRRLVRSANFTGRVKQSAKAERRATIERVQNAICILLLLGLTWTMGYILLIRAVGQVAQALFIVFNSFQGLFIFVLYCVRKPSIRKQWVTACCGVARRRDTSSTDSHSHSAGTTGSSSVITGLRPTRWEKSDVSTKTTLDSAAFMFNPTYTVEVSKDANVNFKDVRDENDYVELE